MSHCVQRKCIADEEPPPAGEEGMAPPPLCVTLTVAKVSLTSQE